MRRNPPNEYILYPITSILIITSIKHGIYYVLFDTEDYYKLKDIHWNVEKDIRGKFYVRNTGVNIKLHRLIMDTPKNLVVDHLNHNTLDNRKVNLRNCTTAENNENTNIINKYPNKTTGEYGICYKECKSKRSGKIYKYWRFCVQIKGDKMKYFKTKWEALIYRDECLRKRGL